MNPAFTALLRELQANLEWGLDAMQAQHPELTELSFDDIWAAFWKLHDLAGGRTMTVKITPNDKGTPPGKLADAELHFSEGPLEGLKLIGFCIWERRGGSGRNVTFPARQYSVNGERRSSHSCGRSSTRRRRTKSASWCSTPTASTNSRPP